MTTDTKPPLGAYYEAMGRKLRAARIVAGYDRIVDAADRAGISESTLGAYERGERKPPLPQLVRLAKAYSTTTKALMPDEEPPE